MKDNIYIFSKELTGDYNDEAVGHLLGECQTNFNMGLTIDEMKDSLKINVLSYTYSNEIEPWTIVQHLNTNTWWIVKSDKVERYQNDIGFVYMHSLQLEGAIELLNARDLTDCAFNQGTYSIYDFVYRLIELSNFEFSIYQIQTDLNPNILVKHIKTFENYTLLTALREFLNEYNYCAKLKFNAVGNPDDPDDTYYIEDCSFQFIPKTGQNYLVNDLDISFFGDEREVITVDKNSYGSTVISNADNVISSKSKTYPSVGAIRLSSTEWNITPDNAILRLPSPAFKVNWIAVMPAKTDMYFHVKIENSNISSFVASRFNTMATPSILGSIKNALIDIGQYISNQLADAGLDYDKEEFDDRFGNNIDEFAEMIKNGYTTRFFQDNVVNATTGDIVKGANVPYLARVDISDGSQDYRNFTLADSETRNMLKYYNQALYWDRGKNTIQGFKGISSLPIQGQPAKIAIENGMSTDLQDNSTVILTYSSADGKFEFAMQFNSSARVYNFKDSQWIVNYIPMSDIKIKIDNQNERRDIQLYNQNGKLTDSIALSKLLYSYANEISSANITRYKCFYAWADIPKVGQIVLRNNIEYVINHITYEFHQNDDSSYFIECEFTMSKKTAVKSLLLSPNTNVRDYGIPQKFNIKRKQVYRDYYEIDYVYYDNANVDEPYFRTTTVFAFTSSPNDQQDTFVCQMKLGYENAINGNLYYYYQLETTTYYLSKTKYIVCDFQDNNIIGYGFMNMYGGFSITRLYDPTVSVNTPISYVDENGNLKSVELLFLTPEKLEQNIQTYKDDTGYGSDATPIYNASVLIDETLYNFSRDNYDIKINESSYKKDALEVPVFEYAIQVENSENVFAGSSLLTEHDGCIYLYGFVVGDNLTENNVYDNDNITDNGFWLSLSNGAQISTETTPLGKMMLVRIYSATRYFFADDKTEYGIEQTFTLNKDYAFFRYAFDPLTRKTVSKDLLFIAKKVPQANITNDLKTLTLCINYYKLK